MKRILLDTSAYTNLLKGDENVLDLLGNAEQVFMSVFVLGELYAGFMGGKKEKENRKRLSDFLQRSTVRILPAGEETAEIFGEIKTRLKVAGTPIPINDVWIAAHAFESGSHLIAFDKHFDAVQGLLMWKLGGKGTVDSNQ